MISDRRVRQVTLTESDTGRKFAILVEAAVQPGEFYFTFTRPGTPKETAVSTTIRIHPLTLLSAIEELVKGFKT